ncbi:signal peptide peptidase SppA [Lignipirellula cremea]|uniref:Protease 4 n=1 Tax=Lignipirellula cremea TaxID=2528010 RepID=A0A518DND0_9BACT|nr:signal peptide peptidase SppA [Lignipirellula cremea]QDU93347.1 Protease 4 [Lignipirellula cremea]
MRYPRVLVCAFLGLVSLGACTASPALAAGPKVAEIKIHGAMPESAGSAGIFGELEQNLNQLVSRLDRAAKDDAIKAVVLRLRSPAVGRGKIEEIRGAIQRIRQAGKRVVAEIEQGDKNDYLIASACDEIVMPESGMLMLPGVRAEITFYKGLLEKLGVEADMMQVGDFKGAAEPMTRTSMSPQFRKQFESVIDDYYDQLIDTIAADRELSRAKVVDVIDIGLLTAPAAKKAGLIDEVAYADTLEARLAKSLDAAEVELVARYGKKEVDSDFSGMLGMVKLFELLLGDSKGNNASSKKKIAVVYAVGAITSGGSASSLFGSTTMGSDTIVKALQQAEKDKTVAAVVLRVDSPGGSALASDLIWRQIEQMEKPVIASMGDTAASGGYYISMGCDKIFAEEGTLTGSVGVVGGKVALGGLYDKLGLNTEVISRGKNSGLLSSDSMFSDSERKVFHDMMKETYQQFVAKAAAGRGLEFAAMEKLAGGRVWSGRQAQKNGLVDYVGTLRDALKYAKKSAGIPEDEKAEIMELPKPKTLFEELFEGDSGPLSETAARRVKSAVPGAAERLGEIQTLQSLFSEPAVLLAPYQIRIR